MGDKSVAEKLFIKPGKSLLVLDPPDDWRTIFGTLPPKTKVVEDASTRADVVILFARSRKELEKNLSKTKKRLNENGAIWVAYAKGTSKLKSDINRDTIREYAATVDLTAVSLISVNDDWSALRLKLS